MNDSAPRLRLLPLGGLSEIGMNCLILEYGEEIVVLDCGLMFSDLDQFGVEFVIPDFSYLVERKDRVRAFVITHGHEDHIGSIPFALKAGIHAPIYASAFTCRMIRERLIEHELPKEAELREFRMGEPIGIGHFTFTPVPVNHSIIEAAGFLIDTPVGRIVHTGDFKMDPSPYYGKAMDIELFRRAGDEGVLLLLSDSTNVEQEQHSLSESIIFKKFEQFFQEAEGLTIVSMFSSNVGRIGQVIELARKLGKKVALAGRSMETNVRLGMDAGYLHEAASVLIGAEDIGDYPRSDVIVLSTGSQGEHRSSLIRIAGGEHKHIQLGAGDLVLMSSKFIPGNERAIGRMINNLFRQGAEVLYESVHDIHVSGHATKPELRAMIEAVRPKFMVPVHGEYRHLVHHAKLARSCGITKTRAPIIVNGDILELTPDSLRVVEHVEGERILVEGRDGNDISKLVLKDRRQLGEKGVVFSILVRDSITGEILSGPEILTKGIASEEVEAELVEDAKNVVHRAVKQCERLHREHAPEVDLQETIRVELRRFFKHAVSKKPIVVPIVLEL